jgi:putative MATE family efflux protein
LQGLDRQILHLAVPALGALVAEPLFLVADSLIVGRLGTAPLAGLGIAGSLLATTVGLFIFLAFGATATVARRSGSGDIPGALATGVDGLWLAVGLGGLAAVAGWLLADRLIGAFGAAPEVAEQAEIYLRLAVLGLPGMLVVLAAVGVLRGLRDTRTPLLVAGTGAVVNVGLNLLLVHGVGWGIAGSAIGTALTQTGMAVAVAVVVVRAARRYGTPLRPHLRGVRAAWRAGMPLLARTVSLRAALLLTTYVAAGLGPAPLAAHQVVSTIWFLLALALDALAIAAQALTGSALGAGDVPGARAALARATRWGVWTGVVVGAVLLALAGLLAHAFNPDQAVQEGILAGLCVIAPAQPLAGYVFVLDGVLIGAGDGRYLAWAGVLALAAYVPAALAVAWAAPQGTAGLVWLWLALAGVHTGARALTLRARARGTAWQITGPTR